MSWVNADDSILDAFTDLETDAYGSSAPDDYIRALNRGAIGSRHLIAIDEDPAYITVGARSTGPRRDGDSFKELVAAMRAAVTDGIQPELPPEISMVVWEHEGREVRVCAPGSAPTLRRARIRRRLTALSPLPLLGAITQPLAGSATAAGLAFAPVLPPVHHPDIPPAPVVREMTGDIARPALPYTPGSVTPRLGALHWTVRTPATTAPPPEAAAKDTTPTPPPTLVNPAPVVTPPPAARTAPSPAPTPTPTGQETTAPTEDPTGAPTGLPTIEVSNAPAVTPEPSPAPTVTVTEMIERILQPARGHDKPHNRHWRHHLRGIRRHR